MLDLVDTAATFDEAFGWLTTACGRRLDHTLAAQRGRRNSGQAALAR